MSCYICYSFDCAHFWTYLSYGQLPYLTKAKLQKTRKNLIWCDRVLVRASFSQSKDSAWIFASLRSQGELKKAKKWRQAFLILRNEEKRAQWWNAVRTPKRCANQKRRPAGCRFHREDPKGKKAIAAYSILQNSVKQCQLLTFPELNILTIWTLRRYFLGAGNWQLFGMSWWALKK